MWAIDHTDIACLPSTAVASQILLDLVDDAVAACAHQDLGGLHAGTAAGGALVSLSALGRTAAAALGVAPGTWLRTSGTWLRRPRRST